MAIKRAMLFAAGLGTRLRPLTDRTPKPLVEVAGKPLLDYALDRFEAAGVTRIVVNTHHLAEQVETHVRSRKSRAELCLSREEPVLETGGGVVKALPLLGDAPFFSANSDTIWVDGSESALARLARAYDPERMDALLLLHPRDTAIGYSGPGNFALLADGQLARTSEAPYVFTGLQVLHPRLFAGRRAEPFSVRDLYLAAEGARGALSRMFGLLHDGDWIHVGTMDELREAEHYFAGRATSGT
jgi:MurNAc alpha-1-phosphate uridylyltransferase